MFKQKNFAGKKNVPKHGECVDRLTSQQGKAKENVIKR